MKKGICFRTPTAYFPPAHWFISALEAGAWTMEAHENYQKGGFRKRCQIAGPNGVQTLSIPLEKGKHQAKPIRKVKISYQRNWWREHEQSIRTAYGRAPYFEYYAEAIFEVGRQQHQYLWELNWQLLQVILKLLQAPDLLQQSAAFVPPGASNFQWPAKNDSLKPYPQVFTDRHGFLPGLSILDALFCLGPSTLLHR